MTYSAGIGELDLQQLLEDRYGELNCFSIMPRRVSNCLCLLHLLDELSLKVNNNKFGMIY